MADNENPNDTESTPAHEQTETTKTETTKTESAPAGGEGGSSEG